MKYDFQKAIEQGYLHHAFIIEGPNNLDKLAYVKDIAKAILCEQSPGIGCNSCSICRKIEDDNYPDIYVLEAEKDTVKVSQITELQRSLSNKPLEGERNIAIIKDADKLNSNGYNRLLKTIEEPQGNAVIFLLSENMLTMTDTILSRCIRLFADEKYMIGENNSLFGKAEYFVQLISDRDYFYKKKSFVDENIKDRKSAHILLDDMEKIYRDILMGLNKNHENLSNSEIFKSIKAIEEARIELELSVKPATVIKKLALIIGGRL